MNTSKTIASLVLLFTFIQFSGFSQKQYDVKFDNGTESTIFFVNNDANNILKNYTTLGLFDVKISSIGSVGSVAGPFILNLKHQRFIEETDKMLQAEFFFSPIDEIMLSSSGSYSLFNASFDANYREAFSSKVKTKKKRFNFIESNFYATSTVYRVRLPVEFERKFYYRGGIHYNQYTDDRSIENDGKRTTIEGVRSLAIYGGISKLRMTYLDYKSSKFGDFKTSYFSEMYFDVLFSPILLAYGRHGNYGSYSFSPTEEGLLKLSDYNIKRHPFGFRLGGNAKVPWIKNNKGSEYSYEVAYLPGIEANYFYVSFSYKIYFTHKSKKQSKE